MIAQDGNIAVWAVGAAGFLLGIVIGGAGAYLFFGRCGPAAKLHRELSELREHFSEYRNQVTQHFMRTSELVQQMTRSYRAVYEHLATGARELCSGEDNAAALDNRPQEGSLALDEAEGDDPLGDSPRISDLTVGLETEASRPHPH